MEEKLKEDLKKAQLDRNETKVSTLRLLLSEIHNLSILLRQSSGQEKDLTDQDIISVIQREVKKRKEAAEGFRLGGRAEQAEEEEAELKLLQAYLPNQLPKEELTNLVKQTINEIGATTVADMGKVIGLVMNKVRGQAEGAEVSRIVKEQLSNG